ncbi:MAG: hypothetical protein QM650_01985 [Microlunatus sp.]
MQRVGDWLRPTMVGPVVAVMTLVLLYVPGWIARSPDPASPNPPLFPTKIASYSWHTGWLSAGEMDAASLLYQNGVGVEFGDSPMAVLLGADGSTYRRFAQAEARSTPDDQGDPGPSVLSPDGTFVVIGSSGATGDIEVVALRDGHRRTLSVGAGRTALPTAIGADSRTVLLAVSDAEVNKYAEGQDLGLASIDLTTGRVRDYPGTRDLRGAALSPDGKRIAVASGDNLEVLDAVTGRRIMQIPVEIERDPRCDHDQEYAEEEETAEEDTSVGEDDGYTCPELHLDGDAWSPDGRRIAATLDKTVIVADLSGTEPSLQRVPLTTPDYWAIVLGWRDDSTVLVDAPTDGEENTSELLWVDLTTGDAQTFASYRPNFTGAAMVSVDAARDLIPRWQVESRPIDRGPLPLWAALPVALAAGLLAMLLTAVVRGRLRPSRH